MGTGRCVRCAHGFFHHFRTGQIGGRPFRNADPSVCPMGTAASLAYGAAIYCPRHYRPEQSVWPCNTDTADRAIRICRVHAMGALDSQRVSGPLFLICLFIEFVVWVRYNIPKPMDLKWFKNMGGMVGKGARPHAEKINGGEKAWFLAHDICRHRCGRHRRSHEFSHLGPKPDNIRRFLISFTPPWAYYLWPPPSAISTSGPSVRCEGTI